jgi:hypothetical protein
VQAVAVNKHPHRPARMHMHRQSQRHHVGGTSGSWQENSTCQEKPTGLLLLLEVSVQIQAKHCTNALSPQYCFGRQCCDCTALNQGLQLDGPKKLDVVCPLHFCEVHISRKNEPAHLQHLLKLPRLYVLQWILHSSIPEEAQAEKIVI